MAETLLAVQTRFFDYLLDRSDAGLDLIVDDANVGAKKRFDIYHHAYRASLRGALADNYERLTTFLGPDHFAEAANGYIAAYPSKLRNLRYFGGHFAAFLAQHFPHNPEVAELAELDWHLRHAFDAADTAPLTAADIGAMGDDWITAPLALHPSAALCEVQHNVAAIWSAVAKDEHVPPVEPLPEPVTILVWRKELQPHFRSLGVGEALALTQLANGTGFGDLGEHLADRIGDDLALQTLSQGLATWLADGVLIAP